MQDELFDTPEKAAKAVEEFRSGLETPFWKLMVSILDANIEVVKTQLEEGVGEESLAEVNRLRDKLRTYREIRNTPQDMIRKLTAEDSEEYNPDPFDTVSEPEKVEVNPS